MKYEQIVAAVRSGLVLQAKNEEEDIKCSKKLSTLLLALVMLFEMDIFRAAVYKICDKQKDFVTSEADFDLLTYKRFAGELYIHMRIYQVAEPMSVILGEIFGFLNKIAEMTGIAEINIDESRFPGFLFELVGAIML